MVTLFAFAIHRFRGTVLTFYFLDDFWVMRDAARIRIESAWDLTQLLRFSHPGFLMYRPLTTTAYAYVLHALFGYDSSAYHAAQLLVFAFNVCLVFAITRRLTGSIEAGLAAGIIYVLAPGQAVNAYWLSAFTVTGTVVWLLLMMWAWLSLQAMPRMAACAFLQICGLLASEHATVGPVLCAILATVRREPWRRSAAGLAPASILVAAYLLAKVWYFVAIRPIPGPYAVTFDVRIWSKHLGQYLIACFNVLSLWPPPEAGYLPLGVGLLALLLVALWRSQRGAEAWRLLAGGILIFAVSLGPVLLLRNHYYDHYVCLPAFGMALAVLAACQLISKHGKRLALGLASVLLVIDVATAQRAWRQDSVFRLVINGSTSAALWVKKVQEAGRQGATEVVVPRNAITNSVFAGGEFDTYFPAMPRVRRYSGERPPAAGPAQAVVSLPPFAPSPPLGLDNPAPGWERRWDWLRRLARFESSWGR